MIRTRSEGMVELNFLSNPNFKVNLLLLVKMKQWYCQIVQYQYLPQTHQPNII